MGFLFDTDDELTLPQLRDLVVLHRNDVNDANYESTYEEHDDLYFKDSSGKLYRWSCGSHWAEAASYKGEIRPIKNQYTEQSLISGADALRALADGKEVQCTITGKNDWTKDIYGIQPYYFLGGGVGQFQFRLKPRTIKLELEIPAPFEPKVGDIYFIVHPAFKSGYTCNTFVDTEKHKEFVKYGAWRTKEEIKIVVEQLRKLKEHSK